MNLNELIKIADDVSVSHGTSDALTSTLFPPLDESEELGRLADNFLATFGPLPPPPNPSSTLPSLEADAGDPYNFSWPLMSLTQSQGFGGPSNPPLPPSLTPLPSSQGLTGPSNSFFLSPGPSLPLQGVFASPEVSTAAAVQPTQVDTSSPVIDTTIQTSTAVAMTAPHATVCDALQTLLEKQSKSLTQTVRPAISLQISPSDVILPQAMPDPSPQTLPALPDLTSPSGVVLSLAQALPGPNPQTLPALPNSSPPGPSSPGLEEVLSGASASGQPVEVPSQKRKNLQDKGGVDLPTAEPPVTSRPKRARIESRRNEIANSIGQENTTQKKSRSQK